MSFGHWLRHESSTSNRIKQPYVCDSDMVSAIPSDINITGGELTIFKHKMEVKESVDHA